MYTSTRQPAIVQVMVPLVSSAAPGLGDCTSFAHSSLEGAVRDMRDSSNALLKLRPVSLFYKSGYASGGRTLHYGVI